MATMKKVGTAKTAALARGGGKIRGTDNKTPQNYAAPPTAVMPPVNRGSFSVSSVPTPLDVGGGGAAAATQAAERPSLDDYIKSNFLYTSQENENERMLDDFDADTLRQQQDVEADQSVRRGDLYRRQADAGNANAEDFASRGLGRSGLVFQGQDRINAAGADQENSIAQLLSDLLSGRQQGRAQQEQANRSALNERINQLTSQFNSGQTV